MTDTTQDKGELLHEMPEELWRKNRDRKLRELTLGLGLSLLFFLIWTVYVFLSLSELDILDIIIEGALIAMVVHNFLRTRHYQHGALYRFGIYGLGFVPPYNPRSVFIPDDEIFVKFDDVESCHFLSAGYRCNIIFKDSQLISISSMVVGDESYQIFCEVLGQRFPDLELPKLGPASKIGPQIREMFGVED